ncbi:MAG: hypothetical protein ACYSTG_08850 [Planctomycetota bacterium]
MGRGETGALDCFGWLFSVFLYAFCVKNLAAEGKKKLDVRNTLDIIFIMQVRDVAKHA